MGESLICYNAGCNAKRFDLFGSFLSEDITTIATDAAGNIGK